MHLKIVILGDILISYNNISIINFIAEFWRQVDTVTKNVYSEGYCLRQGYNR